MPKTEKTQDARTALRLPKTQRKKIDSLVAKGKFKNLSEVVRAALEQFLEKQEVD